MSFEKHSQNWQSRAYTERETGRAGESHRIDLESEVFVILSAVATLVKDLCKKKKGTLCWIWKCFFWAIFIYPMGLLSFFFSIVVVKGATNLCALCCIRKTFKHALPGPSHTRVNLHSLTKQTLKHPDTNRVTDRNTGWFHFQRFTDFFIAIIMAMQPKDFKYINLQIFIQGFLLGCINA